MRRVGLFGFLIAAPALAEELPQPLEAYTLLCEGNSARGYSWKDGAWVEDTFEPRRWIVTKSPENQCTTNEAEFGLTGAQGEYLQTICLNVRIEGTEYNPVQFPGSGHCLEGYFANPKGGWTITFSCDQPAWHFSGEVDGRYQHLAPAPYVSFSEKASKDGAQVEIGYCRRIQ